MLCAWSRYVRKADKSSKLAFQNDRRWQLGVLCKEHKVLKFYLFIYENRVANSSTVDIKFQDEAIPSMCHESREQQEESLVTHVKKLERRPLQTWSCAHRGPSHQYSAERPHFQGSTKGAQLKQPQSSSQKTPVVSTPSPRPCEGPGRSLDYLHWPRGLLDCYQSLDGCKQQNKL